MVGLSTKGLVVCGLGQVTAAIGFGENIGETKVWNMIEKFHQAQSKHHYRTNLEVYETDSGLLTPWRALERVTRTNISVSGVGFYGRWFLCRSALRE
jgi:hypothetical protein